MARPPSGEARTRLSLELPTRVRDRLERLREISEADSLTEVIRRALTIYDVLLATTREEGGKVILRRQDGSEREVIIF